MTPTREERFGRHALALYMDAHERCDIVRIVWGGDVTVDEADAMMAVLAPCIADHTPIFVADLSRLGRMPAAAMMRLSARDLPKPPGRHLRLALAGANLRTRILVSLILGAAAFTSREKIEAQFLPSLDEAMEWAERQLRARV